MSLRKLTFCKMKLCEHNFNIKISKKLTLQSHTQDCDILFKNTGMSTCLAYNQ